MLWFSVGKDGHHNHGWLHASGSSREQNCLHYAAEYGGRTKLGWFEHILTIIGNPYKLITESEALRLRRWSAQLRSYLRYALLHWVASFEGAH